jgi:hypothetical protein
MAGAAATAREAMISFLKSGELKAPRAVAAPPDNKVAGAGFVTASFAEGALFLKNAMGEHYRLEWAKEPRTSAAGSAPKDVADRRRALPPGEYTLTCYRVVRRDAQGGEWFISATGHHIRRLVVRAGEEQKIQVDETVRVTGRALPKDGEISIQLKIAGEHGSGLTIYRDGKRIDIGYRVLDGQSKELGRGTLDYG